MKFKVIFIVFNVVIVASFLIVYLMPLVMLGWDYTRVFWARNWGLPVLFIVIIGILNTYFIFNWRVFQLLEQEDWDGLIAHLEKRIYRNHVLLPQQVRILVNAYLVRSNIDGITQLEKYVRERRPRRMPMYAALLGIPYMLRNDGGEMERYFAEFKDARTRDRNWIRWNYAFALVLARKPREAMMELIIVSGATREPVLLLLCLYLLDSVKLDDAQALETVRAGSESLKKRLPRRAWDRELDKARNNVQVVILSKLIDDALAWLFDEEASPPVEIDQTIH